MSLVSNIVAALAAAVLVTSPTPTTAEQSPADSHVIAADGWDANGNW